MKANESKVTMSVALCTYNGARYLQEQLDSITAQTRPPDELVVCDDCSTDQTVDLIGNFAATAPFKVRLYRNEENLGSTKNFEKAIQLCTGDIIALSDQDDVWHPEKLRRFEKAFSSRPNVGMVFSDLEVVDENLKPLGYTAWKSVRFTSLRRRLFSRHPLNILLKHNVVTGCAMAFRAEWRDVILPMPKLGTIDEVHHDYWIALMICSVSAAMSIDVPLVKYRQHEGQQLGLPAPAAMTETQRLKRWLPTRLESEPMLVEAISAQLCFMREGDCAKKHVKDLNKRQSHIKRRLRTKRMRFAGRSSVVIRELLTLRYFRYSEAWSDVVRDIIPAKVVSWCMRTVSRRWFCAVSAYFDSRRNRRYIQESGW